MPVYSIVGVTVNDEPLFQKYVEGHTDSLTKFGGRFLAAGSEFDVIEGARPGRCFARVAGSPSLSCLVCFR